MFSTQYPFPDGQKFCQRACGTSRISRLPAPAGEIVAGGEGVGVINTQLVADRIQVLLPPVP
ncbi:MAG: hypothetical protein QM619_04560 [Micropruina sp.]